MPLMLTPYLKSALLMPRSLVYPFGWTRMTGQGSKLVKGGIESNDIKYLLPSLSLE